VHVRVSSVTRRGKTYQYVQLVESVRRKRDGVPVHQVIANLGRISDPDLPVAGPRVRGKTGRAVGPGTQARASRPVAPGTRREVVQVFPAGAGEQLRCERPPEKAREFVGITGLASRGLQANRPTIQSGQHERESVKVPIPLNRSSEGSARMSLV
jgi:hypothetical protein